MKTYFYIDGKETTRKAVKEMLGDNRLKEMLQKAKESFWDDPLTRNDFLVGNGILTIQLVY